LDKRKKEKKESTVLSVQAAIAVHYVQSFEWPWPHTVDTRICVTEKNYYGQAQQYKDNKGT
jgi:hypothetical protein